MPTNMMASGVTLALLKLIMITSMDLTNAKPPFSLNGTWPILTCENSEPVKKFPHGSVENSIISPGCVIKGSGELHFVTGCLG